MELPKDATMLLSFVNLKLRDFYKSLDELCEDLGVSQEEIKEKLALIDYEYDSELNKFV